jgi:hypothetical protein
VPELAQVLEQAPELAQVLEQVPELAQVLEQAQLRGSLVCQRPARRELSPASLCFDTAWGFSFDHR